MLDLVINKINYFVPKWISSRFVGDISKHGFKRYFKNTTWMFISRMFLMVTNFFIGAFLARYLQPTDFGTYNYIISFVGLFTFISGLGIDAILGRELILYPEKKQKILGSAMYINAISAFVALIATNVFSLLIEKNPQTQFLIFIFSLTFLFQASSVFSVYFLSTVQAKKSAYIQITASVINSLLKIIGFILGFSLTWFIVLFIIDSIVNTIWSLIIFKKMNEHIDLHLDKKIIYHLIRQAFPFTLSIVATSIYMKIDQVIIKHMLGADQTGIYSVAVRLTETWYFIPSLICTSLFPAIVNAKKINIRTYYSRVNSLLLLMLVIAIIFAIPIFIITPFIIKYLYGVSYLGAIVPFQIYIWSSIPIFIMPALAAYVTTESLGKNLLFSTICGAIVNVLLNVALIPSHGIIGSAFATFISYLIPTIYLYTIFKKHQKKETHEHH
jgi:O-antigen/teichoic acid export membrane protein